LRVKGNGYLKLKKKFKSLKQKLKEWNSSVVSDYDEHISGAKEVLYNLDSKEEEVGLKVEEVSRRKEAMVSLYKQSRLLMEIATRGFCHRCISRRKRRNTIHGILVDDISVFDVDGVKGEIKDHFVSMFEERCRVRVGLEEIDFDVINVDQWLIAPFSMEEIRMTV
jgi:hypothetical protein